MKKTIILSLTFGIAFLISCKKERIGDTTLSGRILEYGTENPIAGATVYLGHCISEGIFEPVYCVIKDSLIVGTDGWFEFTIEEKFDGDYIVDATAPGYEGSEFGLIATNPGDQREGDIILDPFSWLSIHVHNVNPQDENDNIEIGGSWGGGASDDIFFGTQVNKKILRKTYGNRQETITWGVVRNGEQSIYRDSFYIPAHDTIYYEIFY